MITHRPGLPSIYELPDVDPKLVVVHKAQAIELLPTPAPQALIDPVAAAIAAADARSPQIPPPVDQIAAEFVRPVEAAATAPFPADVQPTVVDAILQ